MGNLWLKIKIWTKGIVIGVLVVYALLFILNNSGQSVKFWFWIGREHETSLLVLVLVTFLAGVIGTILVRTTLKTIHQVRDLRQRGRLDKVEREQAEMKAKAAMLQVKTPPPTSAERGATNEER